MRKLDKLDDEEIEELRTLKSDYRDNIKLYRK
jgi:2-oxo-4-hydroxy-4-carboxy--5-ureidoimidazoline (OHCU) decarboxylase